MKKLQLLTLTMLVAFAGINLLDAKKCPAGQKRNAQGKCVKASRVNKAKAVDKETLKGWKVLSGNGDNIASISASQIASMTTRMISVIPDEDISEFTATQMTAFTPGQLQSFDKNQVQGLTANQLNIDNVLANLSTDQIAYLQSNSNNPDEDQLNNLIDLWTNSLSANAIRIVSYFSKDQLKGLSANSITKILAVLSTHQLADVLPQLTPSQMTLINVANLSRDQLMNLTDMQVQALTEAQIQELSGAQLSAKNNKIRFTTKLSAIQLGYLSTIQISELEYNALLALPNSGAGLSTVIDDRFGQSPLQIYNNRKNIYHQ